MVTPPQLPDCNVIDVGPTLCLSSRGMSISILRSSCLSSSNLGISILYTLISWIIGKRERIHFEIRERCTRCGRADYPYPFAWSEVGSGSGKERELGCQYLPFISIYEEMLFLCMMIHGAGKEHSHRQWNCLCQESQKQQFAGRDKRIVGSENTHTSLAPSQNSGEFIPGSRTKERKLTLSYRRMKCEQDHNHRITLE